VLGLRLRVQAELQGGQEVLVHLQDVLDVGEEDLGEARPKDTLIQAGKDAEPSMTIWPLQPGPGDHVKDGADRKATTAH
jgi:hypothetical protein